MRADNTVLGKLHLFIYNWKARLLKLRFWSVNSRASNAYRLLLAADEILDLSNLHSFPSVRMDVPTWNERVKSPNSPLALYIKTL